ncbi:hypothetical protein M422DRAFT_245176 [Sphaerobolus stellatus SS14]|nr:hypothetical protein M422DRAFT_245176 [Sphaerobolus stellatus SS14]
MVIDLVNNNHSEAQWKAAPLWTDQGEDSSEDESDQDPMEMDEDYEEELQEVAKFERQHRPSSEFVTEPESETEPKFQPEQTKATTASKVNYSKFYPGEFKPTTHISPALQLVKPLSNVPLVNSSHAKQLTLKREASSSPKVRDDDKENIHPGPPPLKH